MYSSISIARVHTFRCKTNNVDTSLLVASIVSCTLTESLVIYIPRVSAYENITQAANSFLPSVHDYPVQTLIQCLRSTLPSSQCDEHGVL